MSAKLYAMAHSHPAIAVRLMLEHKRIEAEVWDILPGLHPIVVRAAGFPGRTVPALRIDGERIQGTLAISRRLDEIQPDPPLFPPEPHERAAVEAAERWGHDGLQALARRVFRYAALTSRPIRAWMAGEVAGMPLPRLAGIAYKPVIIYFARIVGATEDAVRRDLERLPAMLDHCDALLAAGTIGGPQPNAADFQILSSIRLLLCHAELRAIVERWRCARAALELVPAYPGPIPAALPPQWLPSAGPASSVEIPAPALS
jgi:glutathione S-transferase